MKSLVTRIVLLPFAFIYGFVVWIRNRLFNWGILPQKSYDTCVLVVGNLSAGGTGKTPHIIALAEMLKQNYELAILSRGYKRKSKGFRWVELDDHPELSGDEPLEIKLRLQDIPVATCKNRRLGIEQILKELNPKPDIILMDDGFQHRFVKPDYSLILTRNNLLYSEDSLLPVGRLREPARAIKRAHTVCITDRDEAIDPKDIEHLRKRLKLSENQKLISSRITYDSLESQDLSPESHILLLTSIAFPESLFIRLDKQFQQVTHLKYPDHHSYTQKEIQKIITTFNSIPESSKMIVTTGKDLVKLKHFPKFMNLPHLCAEINIIINESELKKDIQTYAG